MRHIWQLWRLEEFVKCWVFSLKNLIEVLLLFNPSILWWESRECENYIIVVWALSKVFFFFFKHLYIFLRWRLEGFARWRIFEFKEIDVMLFFCSPHRCWDGNLGRMKTLTVWSPNRAMLKHDCGCRIGLNHIMPLVFLCRVICAHFIALKEEGGLCLFRSFIFNFQWIHSIELKFFLVGVEWCKFKLGISYSNVSNFMGFKIRGILF